MTINFELNYNDLDQEKKDEVLESLTTHYRDALKLEAETSTQKKEGDVWQFTINNLYDFVPEDELELHKTKKEKIEAIEYYINEHCEDQAETAAYKGFKNIGVEVEV